MAKLKNDPVGSTDLIEFLETSSDFAFELACIERMSQLGYSCQHGGLYVDPVTKKARQFDIRAQIDDRQQLLRVRCAIECKNLTESFPLLVMCVPRPGEESFHDLVFSFESTSAPQKSMVDVPGLRKVCHAIRIENGLSEYKARSPVGKSLVQVGRANDRTLIANDAEVFEKWSQALSSASDLADEAAWDGENHKTTFISLILPILVVPNGTLWQVDYLENGERNGAPAKVDRCSFFVGREYEAGDRMRGSRLTISHLEFVTLAGLDALTKSIAGNAFFPPIDTMEKLVKEQCR